jgi:hypothetical protein
MAFLGVCCYLPFFTSDFTNLDLFPLHFSQICQGLINLVYFFKEPTFCFIDSLYGFFGCFNFNPYFYYFCPSAWFGLCLFLFF